MTGDALSPELQAIAAEARREMRAEAEEAEREAAAAAAMGRRLPDVLHEIMLHGDTVSVTAGRRRFTGEVVHAGADVASLLVGGDRVDVNLASPVVVGVVRPALAGGRSPSPDWAPSLRARMLELMGQGEVVELVTTTGEDSLAGRVGAVSADHVMVQDPADGGRWYVPLAAVAFVRVADRGWA